jgi:TonB family protein
MASSTPVRTSPEKRLQSANDRWKGHWSRWVMVSTLFGAGAHFVVFIVWPAWEIVDRRVQIRQEFVQLEPIIAGAGAELGDDGDATPAVPDLENVEIEVVEGGEGGVEMDLAAMLEMFGPANATIAQPVMPRAAYGEAAPPLPPLSLEEVVTLSPRLASATLAVSMPVIRNPVSFQRFLRTRYNPLHQQPNGSGSVSVAMWINARGAVEWTAIEESSGFPQVDAIALDAFRDVVSFTPARSEGSRIPVSVIISVPFSALW